MQRIMFSEQFCLQEAVLKGFKTQTRRVATTKKVMNPQKGKYTEGLDKGKACLCEDFCKIVAKSKYRVGEVVAIAESYMSLGNKMATSDKNLFYGKVLDAHKKEKLADVAGFTNKQYVMAKFMPHHIKITKIRVERLQDISEEDARAEGVRTNELAMENCCVDYPLYSFWNQESFYATRREAFCDMMKEMCGLHIWNQNPWVFVYEFELVD